MLREYTYTSFLPCKFECHQVLDACQRGAEGLQFELGDGKREVFVAESLLRLRSSWTKQWSRRSPKTPWIMSLSFIIQHFDVSSGKFVDFAHALPRLHFRYNYLKQEHLGAKQGNIFQALKALPMEVLNQKVWEDWVGWTWIHSENMKGHTASTHPPIIMEVKNESLQD